MRKLPEPVSLSLEQSLRRLVTQTEEPAECVAESLTMAAVEGRITATGCLHASYLYDEPEYYFDAPALPRTHVPSEAWGEDVCWEKGRVGRYDLVRFDRAEITRWLDGEASAGASLLPPPGAPQTDATSPLRRRSRPPIKFDATVTKMRADLEAGRLTPDTLKAKKEKELEALYEVSRDTARKARSAVLTKH